jgi:hypothetical protein
MSSRFNENISSAHVEEAVFQYNTKRQVQKQSRGHETQQSVYGIVDA